jgi:hypothetical protein
MILGDFAAVGLFGFGIAGDGVATNRMLLYGLLVSRIWGISSAVAVLFAYGSEVYPTRIWSRGGARRRGQQSRWRTDHRAPRGGRSAPPSRERRCSVRFFLWSVFWRSPPPGWRRSRGSNDITAEQLRAPVLLRPSYAVDTCRRHLPAHPPRQPVHARDPAVRGGDDRDHERGIRAGHRRPDQPASPRVFSRPSRADHVSLVFPRAALRPTHAR